MASQGEVAEEGHPSVWWAGAGLGGWFHSWTWEREASLQKPKLVLVMEPTMDLSTSQVRPRSQGHL